MKCFQLMSFNKCFTNVIHTRMPNYLKVIHIPFIWLSRTFPKQLEKLHENKIVIFTGIPKLKIAIVLLIILCALDINRVHYIITFMKY